MNRASSNLIFIKITCITQFFKLFDTSIVLSNMISFFAVGGCTAI